MPDALPSYALLAVLSVLGAGLLLLAIGRLGQRRPRTPPVGGREPAILLFEDGILADATPAAQDMLRLARCQGTDIDDAVDLLSRRFPDLRTQIAHGDERQVLTSATGDATLEILRWGQHLRLTVSETSPGQMHFDLLEGELQTLRSIAEDSPQLIWKEDAAGAVVWANRSYLGLAASLDPQKAALWPAQPLFGAGERAPPEGGQTIRRASVVLPGRTEPQWFEITTVRRGEETVNFAVDAQGIVAAEVARQNFVQTLTKTFAHLSTGLAIFDRERRLALFNPAFLDMTGLPVPFLSSRPLVHSVLDRMRDMNMLPEPRDYASWREKIAALEAAAERGTYRETWSLPGGQTFRVTGRPHPDGAIAFLFEDISDEIRLTRRFRSEQETTQAALDALEEGIAVFSAAGTLVLTNAAYAGLWGDRGNALQDAGVASELAAWSAATAPSPDWAEVEAQLRRTGERRSWEGVFALTDGRQIAVRLQPLPGGATMLTFRRRNRREQSSRRAGRAIRSAA